MAHNETAKWQTRNANINKMKVQKEQSIALYQTAVEQSNATWQKRPSLQCMQIVFSTSLKKSASSFCANQYSFWIFQQVSCNFNFVKLNYCFWMLKTRMLDCFFLYLRLLLRRIHKLSLFMFEIAWTRQRNGKNVQKREKEKKANSILAQLVEIQRWRTFHATSPFHLYIFTENASFLFFATIHHMVLVQYSSFNLYTLHTIKKNF